MVGVPGKYKGCETCRLRRVKCDNQRPHCRKCLDGGRACAGYERETVFIIGTLEDQGRCSSHPPRVVKSGGGSSSRSSSSNNGGSGSKKKAAAAAGSGVGGRGRGRGRGATPTPTSRRGVEDGGGEIVFVPEGAEAKPAWDDLVEVVYQGTGYRLQVAGLRTDLNGVVRGDHLAWDGDGGGVVSVPGYRAMDVQPGMVGEEDFWLAAQCLVHVAAPGEGLEGAEGVCLFLYEHNNCSYFSNQPHWKDPSAQTNAVRRLGPEYFRSFPAHHFFVRVYRPNAIMTALLNRTPTFLAEPQWLSTPFEAHPKSPLDRLLDILAVLPSLLARADRVLGQEHTLTRRLMAQDLMNNCLDLEVEMARWYTALQQNPSTSGGGGGGQPQPLFWLSDPSSTAATGEQPSFPNPLTFQTTHAALALSYYWTALVLFYPALWRLYFAAVIEPVTVFDTAATSSFTPHGGDLPVPTRLQTLDPMRYSLPKVREAAVDACRALDFLVIGAVDGSGGSSGWVQPDLLWHSLFVVSRFYGELGGEMMQAAAGIGGLMGPGGGGIELLWCERFRERLVERGREMREVVLGRRWVDVASF
ncbi:hypothetical protein C8A01DRAFT_35072 [Parachaetomium inaequale]|uniref:Zn(2)-C6 fungal-type domain-containing protein n=1 Tax=Parachaetomium inaequale TaxID=2588326 RepID=A0AAN6PLW9_9PEZI|nr:hypothetical protein C8A01DRAFT_35072 [Parachaetomium inaequale]